MAPPRGPGEQWPSGAHRLVSCSLQRSWGRERDGDSFRVSQRTGSQPEPELPSGLGRASKAGACRCRGAGVPPESAPTPPGAPQPHGLPSPWLGPCLSSLPGQQPSPQASVMVVERPARGVCRVLTGSPRVKTQESPYLCPSVQTLQEAGMLGGRPLAAPPGTAGGGGGCFPPTGHAPSPLGPGAHSDGQLWVLGLETGLLALHACPSHLALPRVLGSTQRQIKKISLPASLATCVLPLGSPQGEGDSPDPAPGPRSCSWPQIPLPAPSPPEPPHLSCTPRSPPPPWASLGAQSSLWLDRTSLTFSARKRHSHPSRGRRRGARGGSRQPAAGSPQAGRPRAFALTLETVSSAVWLTTCSAVALKLSTLINHPEI